MSTFRFVAVKLCFCLIIGILIGNYFDPGIWKSIFITSLLIVLLLLQFQKSTRVINFGLLALLTTVSVGVLSVSLANPLNYKSFYGYHAGEEDETWVLKIRETLKNSPFANRYYAETLKNSQLKLSGKMLLEASINDSIPVFQVDDLILLRGKPLMISPPLNPGDFDYRQYLKNLGIHYRIRLDKEKLVYHEKGQKTLYGLANHIKQSLLAKLSYMDLEPEVRAIIQALLLGHRDDISSETFGYYKDSGAIHILAISGLHIGILLLFLRFLTKPLERIKALKKYLLVFQILILWGFAFLSGLSASVIRAVTMFSFFAYALALNRPTNSYNILAISILFITLVVNPYLLFQVGFQLSYAAVLGIIFLLPVLKGIWLPTNFILRKGYDISTVSLAAQAGVLPLSLYYFHQFPSLFFVTNLLLMPVLGLVLIIGLVILVWLNIGEVPDLLLESLENLIKYMNAVVEIISQWEWFNFTDIDLSLPGIFAAYAVLISLVWWYRTAHPRYVMVILIVLFLMSIWVLVTEYKATTETWLMVPHRYKEHVLVEKIGGLMNVYEAAEKNTGLKRLLHHHKIDNIHNRQPVHFMEFYGKRIIRLDSTAYLPENTVADIILLSYSPKINLERLLDKYCPEEVVADGSNYPWLVRNWQRTSAKLDIPFHYTAEAGAYTLIKSDLVDVAH